MALDIAAHALGGLAQPVFQPRDLAELLGLERLCCRIDKAMQFLGPGVYRFVGFFLPWAGFCRASASRSSTYCWAKFMNCS